MVVTAKTIHESDRFKVTLFYTIVGHKEFYVIYPKKDDHLDELLFVTVYGKEALDTKCYEAVKKGDFNFDDFLSDLTTKKR